MDGEIYYHVWWDIIGLRAKTAAGDFLIFDHTAGEDGGFGDVIYFDSRTKSHWVRVA